MLMVTNKNITFVVIFRIIKLDNIRNTILQSYNHECSNQTTKYLIKLQYII